MVEQLYPTQCEWYRELTHVRTVTGDTSPPPSLHVTDIYLERNDSDTVRLTGDLMYSNRDTVVSVTLLEIDHSLHKVVQLLQQCPKLSALYILYMSNKEDHDILVSVMPRLTQLTTVQYGGDDCLLSDADRTVVAAVMSLTQLERVGLHNIRLSCDGLEGTDAMTRLRTVVLYDVSMTARGWGTFVSSLLSLPQSVSVVLQMTDIDEGTVRRIRTSDRVTVTEGEGRYEFMDLYVRLEFTTVPSQTADT